MANLRKRIHMNALKREWSASAIDIFHEIMGYECDDEMAQGIISDFIEKHVTEDTFRAWMVTARKQTLDSLG